MSAQHNLLCVPKKVQDESLFWAPQTQANVPTGDVYKYMFQICGVQHSKMQIYAYFSLNHWDVPYPVQRYVVHCYS